MRTSDIYYLNCVREFLGISNTEAAYYLGGAWKSWSRFTVNKLREHLNKRIEKLEREAREFRSLMTLVQNLRDIDQRIASMPDFEKNLLKRYKSLTVDQIKDLSIDNETTPSNLIKAMKASGWKLTRQGRKNVWVFK